MPKTIKIDIQNLKFGKYLGRYSYKIPKDVDGDFVENEVMDGLSEKHNTDIKMKTESIVHYRGDVYKEVIIFEDKDLLEENKK